jgi:hypothetical protein
VLAALVIAVIWSGSAAFYVVYVWVGVTAVVLTNDSRPAANTPRTALPKVRS